MSWIVVGTADRRRKREVDHIQPSVCPAREHLPVAAASRGLRTFLRTDERVESPQLSSNGQRAIAQCRLRGSLQHIHCFCCFKPPWLCERWGIHRWSSATAIWTVPTSERLSNAMSSSWRGQANFSRSWSKMATVSSMQSKASVLQSLLQQY